jgi:hypothetical protein
MMKLKVEEDKLDLARTASGLKPLSAPRSSQSPTMIWHFDFSFFFIFPSYSKFFSLTL